MKRLAVLGGEPILSAGSPSVSVPVVNETGRRLVNEVLDSGQISLNPVVGRFEKAFGDYVGSPHVIACNSGTSSLLAALYAVGVEPGDEVLVPSYTFWASATLPFLLGAVPVFYDVDPVTWLADAGDIRGRITPRTRALIVVHTWGSVCDMEAILAVAKPRGVRVIEDAAHAHGARWRGQHVGLAGDVGCFSLQGTKTLPGGEGGVLVTKERELYERALALGFYDRLQELPVDSPYRQYWLTGLGNKFRPHPLAMALALGRLETLDELNHLRDSQGLELEQKVADLGYLVPQRGVPGTRRVYSYHYMRYDSEQLGGLKLDSLLAILSAEGLTAGYCGYGRLHQARLFLQGGSFRTSSDPVPPVSLPVSERLGRETFFAAPRFERPCPEVVDAYVSVYRAVREQLDELLVWEEKYRQSSVRQDVRSSSLELVTTSAADAEEEAGGEGNGA
ncbi:MAG: DegT/DnrJ/EryC1/StrS family aminotransferase [Bacillota bacterium]|nr:DegT/DnrJ/EryC1/StrS family aminotransferase [Bacillota bacterium]